MTEVQDTARKIRRMQDSVKESDAQIAEQKGRRKELLDRLKREFEVDSVEEGNELHDRMCDEFDEAKARLDEISDELDELVERSE